MIADWLHTEVNRTEWLPGRAAWPNPGWPPDEGSVFGSGIGLGTAGFWPGDDSRVRQAHEVVRTAIRSGIRLIDTATNYGHGFAEAAIGAAVRAAVTEGHVDRSDVAVVSKAGYLPDGGAAGPAHSADPAFLRREVAASRARMGLCTIDAYLLHNLEEQMLPGGSGWEGLPDALRALEAEASEGHIGCYGVAAAEGFLDGDPGFHSLERLLECAQRAGCNHFRVIELPVSLWRREAFSTAPYTIRGSPATILELAKEAGLIVLASIPMGHGWGDPQAVEFLRALFPDCGIESPAMMALQFARSVPGVHAALPGISTLAHLGEAVELSRIPRWDLEAIKA